MAIEFTESAGRHGFSEADAIHAMTFPLYVQRPFDASRVPGGVCPDLYIGPARGGLTIEVMAFTRPPRTLVIFHVMELREKFRHLIDKENS